MLTRYQESAHKLGSEVVITIVDDQNPSQMFKYIWGMIDEFEDNFSRFRPYSEVSKLNMIPGKKFKASGELIDIIKLSNNFHKNTFGIYNPLILPSLQRVGYLSSWPNPAATSLEQLDYRSRKAKPNTYIEVGDNFIKLPPGSALDLGGIGKGYLLDKLHRLLTERGVKNFFLSLGGDLICSGSDLSNKGWKVGVASALKEDEDIDQVCLAGGKQYRAIASSGVTKRRGQDWHHLIDPRTVLPSKSDIVMASVISAEGVTSDILAKVLLINGSSEAQAIAESYNIGYLLQVVKEDKIEIVKHNWN